MASTVATTTAAPLATLCVAHLSSALLACDADIDRLVVLPAELRERIFAAVVSSAPSRLSDAALSSLISPNTSRLDLSGLHRLECAQLARSIATCAAHLTELRLDTLAAVDADCLPAALLALHASSAPLFPSLRKLSLSRCAHATTSTLLFFLQHAPRLASLRAAGCSLLQLDAALMAAVKAHACLALLDLSRSGSRHKCAADSSAPFDPFAADSEPGELAAAPPRPSQEQQQPEAPEQEEVEEPTTTANTDGLELGSSSAPSAGSLRFLSLNHCKAWVDDRTVAFVARTFGSSLLELHLKECWSITDAAVDAVTNHCPRLTVLRVDFCHTISDDAVCRLVHSAGARLRSFSLSGCYLVTERSIDALAANCPNLSSISLVDCDRIGSLAIESLVEQCPRLESVDLSRLANVASTIDTIATKCTQLTKLKWSSNSHAVSQRTCQRLARVAGSTLTSFAANDHQQLDDACLIDLAKYGCTRLERLHLANCARLSDSAIEHLAHYNASHLRSITLANNRLLTDRALKAIADHCPNLETLDVASCSAIRTSGFLAIATRCRSLRSLNLSGCKPKRLALEALTSRCQRLESLRMTSKHLTDAMLHSLLRESPLLRELHIDGANRLSERAFEPCTDKSLGVRLQHVRLIECRRINDTALQALLQGCARSLTELYLIRCPLVSDLTIEHVASVNQASAKSTTGGAAVGELESLFLCQNPAISKPAVRRLRTLCPHLSVMGSFCDT